MKRVLIALFLVFGLTLAIPLPALAQDSATDAAKESLCEGVGLTGGDCEQESSGVKGMVQTVVNALSWIVGIAAVIMILIGGLKYVTSSGDSNSINSAKNTIMFAVVGLVVALLAQFAVRFVIERMGAATKEETTSLVTTA